MRRDLKNRKRAPCSPNRVLPSARAYRTVENELSATEIGLDAASRGADRVKDRVLQLDAKNDELREELHVWQPGQHQAPLEVTDDHRRCQVTGNYVEVQKACFAAEDCSGHRNAVENKKLVLENTTLRKDLLKPKVQASLQEKKLARHSKGVNSVDRWGGYDTVRKSAGSRLPGRQSQDTFFGYGNLNCSNPKQAIRATLFRASFAQGPILELPKQQRGHVCIHKRLGLRAMKSVSAHLLVEDAYGGNLLPDIATVDYLAGHKEHTHCRTLAGLLTFVDDVYVFGHLRKGDIVCSGSHVLCTAGDEGAAKHEVSRIVLAARKAMGTSRRHIPINILHITASRDNCEGSAIQANIGRIQAKHTKTH